MKKVEIKALASMLGVEEEGLEKMCEQISEVTDTFILRDEVGEDEVVVGKLDEFERKAIAWAYKQEDSFLEEFATTMVFTRIISRLNLKCTFSLKMGGKIAVKKKLMAAQQKKGLASTEKKRNLM